MLLLVLYKSLIKIRIVNISLGRPLALHDDDIHVPLPSALDSDTLNEDSTEATSPTQITSPFLHHTRLRRIQSTIHRSMYTSRLTQSLSLRERQEIRRKIFHDLQLWQRDISHLPLPSTDQPSNISSSSLNPSWYQALYHSACLLLFRPSATFPAMEGHESDEDIDDVLQMIWTSSRSVLNRYFELLRAHHLNYSWVCLYSIFMAGLANVYSVGCCAQRRKRGIVVFLPPFLDVVSDFRDCSNILTAICERWHDARGSCDIFTRLSMSALKELTAATFQPRPGNTTAPSRADSANCQMADQPAFGDVPHGQDGQWAGPEARPNFATRQGLSMDLPDTSLPLDSYLDGHFPDVCETVEFQQLFQEMQNSVHTGDHIATDEVTLGFSQEWFER